MQNLYSDAFPKLKIIDIISGEIEITKGVLKGKAISPLVFSFYINDLELHIRYNKLIGLNVARKNDVVMVAYPGDLAVLCNWVVKANQKLNSLEINSKNNKMVVNTQKKTKILAFCKDRYGPR